MGNQAALNRRSTLVEEMLAEDNYDRRYGIEPLELTHLEPAELARHIEETCKDPSGDFASFYADGLNDMAMVDRPKMNALVRRLLLGEITVEEQARLNEIAIKAMLAHGVHEVQAALDQTRVGHEVAATLARVRRGGSRQA